MLHDETKSNLKMAQRKADGLTIVSYILVAAIIHALVKTGLPHLLRIEVHHGMFQGVSAIGIIGFSLAIWAVIEAHSSVWCAFNDPDRTLEAYVIGLAKMVIMVGGVAGPFIDMALSQDRTPYEFIYSLIGAITAYACSFTAMYVASYNSKARKFVSLNQEKALTIHLNSYIASSLIVLLGSLAINVMLIIMRTESLADQFMRVCSVLYTVYILLAMRPYKPLPGHIVGLYLNVFIFSFSVYGIPALLFIEGTQYFDPLIFVTGSVTGIYALVFFTYMCDGSKKNKSTWKKVP